MLYTNLAGGHAAYHSWIAMSAIIRICSCTLLARFGNSNCCTLGKKLGNLEAFIDPLIYSPFLQDPLDIKLRREQSFIGNLDVKQEGNSV